MSATPVPERAHEDGAAADAASVVISMAVSNRAHEGGLAGGAAGDAASAVASTAVAKRTHEDAVDGGAAGDAASSDTSTAVGKRTHEDAVDGGAAADAASAVTSTPAAKRTREDGAAADAAPKRQCRRDKPVRVSRMAMPGVTDISSVFASDDGELFVGTKSALYLKSPAGRVTLIAGHPSECGFKDGESTEARFNTITGLALMRDGGVVLVDHNNHSVRLVSPSGKVTTVAGNGKAGFADGHGDKARFDGPWSIVVGRNGRAFITDARNHCIRQLLSFASSNWYVETICGKGQEKGFVNGPAKDARFEYPRGLALNMQEDLIVADGGNNSVRKVVLPNALPNVRVTTVTGSFDDAAVQFDNISPVQVAVDGNNFILVRDWFGRVIQISEEDCMVLVLENEGDTEFCCSVDRGICIDKKGRVIVAEYDTKYPLVVVHAGLLSPFTRATSIFAPRSLQTDYTALLADPSLMDATFAVDGGVFRAHRLILGARSLVFKQLFRANAATDAQIPIADIPGPVFETVLRYLYTGQYSPMTACTEGVSFVDVARAAKKLDVQGLYQDCLEEFKETLAVRSVIGDLIEAHKKGLSEFEEAAIEFIEDNARCFCNDQWNRMEDESLCEFEDAPDLAKLLLRVTRTLVCKMGI